MSALNVRPYDERDREAVRQLCWQTAYQGRPIDFLYADRASWVDLFTRYFTDRAPEGCFVACDADGRLLGYLLGSADARQETRFQARELLRHFLLRWVWLRRGCAGFWFRFFFDSVRGRGGAPAPDSTRWPAGFHIDLDARARGTGIADALLERFVGFLRTRGVTGCHADLLDDNVRMQRFLARHGFVPEGEPFDVPGMRTPGGSRVRGRRMVRALSSAG